MRLSTCDTAGRGDPAEVVAHHVDDHQILGALLRRTGELRGLAIILCRESTPPSGTLHRAHDQAIALPREEELRGERNDGLSAAVEEGSVRRGARGRQLPEQDFGVAGEAAPQGKGEIDLVSLPGGNRLADLGDRLRVRGLAEAGLQRHAIRASRTPAGEARPPAAGERG